MSPVDVIRRWVEIHRSAMESGGHTISAPEIRSRFPFDVVEAYFPDRCGGDGSWDVAFRAACEIARKAEPDAIDKVWVRPPAASN